MKYKCKGKRTQEDVQPMKAKTKFMRMYRKLPLKAKCEFVVDAFTNQPKSLPVCYMEIWNDTPLGKKMLRKLGYADDKN